MKPYKKIHAIPYEHVIPSACGPGALKITLSHFGENYSELELSKLCHYTKENGTEYFDMIKAAKKLGAKVIVPKARATLKQVEYYIKTCGVPVLFAWFYCLDFSIIPGGHYSVIVNIDKNYVLFMDPAQGAKLTRMKRKIFESLWFGFVGVKEEKVLWNWFMIPTFGKIPLTNNSRYA